MSSEDLAFNLQVTYRCLKSWEDLKNDILGVSYVDILNVCLKAKEIPAKVKDNKEMEARLVTLCAKVRNELRGQTGHKYMKIANGRRNVSFRWRELESFHDAEQKLMEANEKVKVIEKERNDLQERCESLYQDLLQEQARQRFSEESARAEQAKFENVGRAIPELKERQQRRKLGELKSKVQAALSFAETFGLQLNSATFQDEKGNHHSLEYQPQDKKSFKDLPEQEQEKIQQILFITDKFAFGEAAYHELTKVDGNEQLPRSYLVKQCKQSLNKLCHVF